VSQAEASERGAIERERELARVKAETAAKEREKAGAAAKVLDTATQIERIESEIRAIQFARSSLTEQQGTLERRLANLAREYAEAEGDSLRQSQIRLEAAKTMDQLMGVQAKLQDQIAQAADKEADARERSKEAAREQAQNSQRILDLTAQASQIQADAMQRMGQVGRVQSGNIGLGDYAMGIGGRGLKSKADRELKELERADAAEARGNLALATRIREKSAQRQERGLPAVGRANDAERSALLNQAKDQTKQLGQAVTELTLINEKLAQG
jgi:hypothetical protein